MTTETEAEYLEALERLEAEYHEALERLCENGQADETSINCAYAALVAARSGRWELALEHARAACSHEGVWRSFMYSVRRILRETEQPA